MDVKSRYRGIQSVLLNCGNEGCLFLSLMSIAEEVSQKPIDLIDAINILFGAKCIKPNFYVLDSLEMLKILTGKTWHRRVVKKLPDTILDNQFTIAHWYNEKTGLNHFRRRCFDTLWDSKTVKNGEIKQYYLYWYDEE